MRREDLIWKGFIFCGGTGKYLTEKAWEFQMPSQLPERNRLKVYRQVKQDFSQFCQEEHANSPCLGDFEKSSNLAKNEEKPSTFIKFFQLHIGKCHFRLFCTF